MHDRTNYFQSVIHMLKGNLGTGMLAMPMSFRHLGHVGAIVALPLLCIISGYCVHILTRGSRRISKRTNEQELTYSMVARRTLELGPSWLTGAANFMGNLVAFALLITQIGVCCVYMIFVVDNITSILASYQVHISQWLTFLAIYPIAVSLGCIRTLNRLAIASLIANMLQVIGLIIIIEYLLRDTLLLTLEHKKSFGSLSEMALGFGSAMFAFEGISVVLPVYNRLKRREQFGSLCGVINVSFVSMLALYFVIGLLGYMRFGSQVKDSITLNLPAEPLYDAVRAMFTMSILLSYPLQCYVPNELIWNWFKQHLVRAPAAAAPGANWHLKECDIDEDKSVPIVSALNVVVHNTQVADPKPDRPTVPIAKLSVANLLRDDNTFQGLTSGKEESPLELIRREQSIVSLGSRAELITNANSSSSSSSDSSSDVGLNEVPLRYEYLSRVFVVTLTFALAISVPKLNLLMDLIGSFSGTLLCLTVPALIHLVSYWESARGFNKCLMIVVDSSIITLSLAAGLCGSYSSLLSIIGINKG